MSRTITPVAPGHNLIAQSMGATFVSPVVDAAQADGIAWEAVYTGTPTGTFTFESSNQYDPVSNPNATFIAIPAAEVIGTLPVPAGAGSQFLVTTPGPSEHRGAGRFQRMRYTRGAGTGVLDSWACGVGKT